MKKTETLKKTQLTKTKQGIETERKYLSLLFVILLITFIAYLPVIHNGFLWDDETYIQKNMLIRALNLEEIFSRFVEGNYHPFTILILALEYKLFELNPAGYHTINILLHLLNVILVFRIVFALSEKGNVALVAALLFGIHPLHVESVAWAAELKDLLYTFFFLASYFFYLKYIKEGRKNIYFFALLLFLFSLLSKAMAVCLPVVFVLTDYFKGRQIKIKTLVEKIPFFILSAVFGAVAIVAQKSSESIQDMAIFSFPQRIVFACYGFVTYLFKSVFPLQLSAYYPYPEKQGNSIPFQFYFYVLLFIAIAGLVFYSLRFSKKIIFGIGFFAITVFLVLQLLPVGNTIMADRYSYIPSIGIFYLAGEGFSNLINKKLKSAALVLLSAFALFFTIKTYARCAVWENGLTLWNDVIDQYDNVPMAYYNRAFFYDNVNQKDLALQDYSKTIAISKKFPEAYVNRGNILRDNNKYELALDDYKKAIEIKPQFSIAYYNRSLLFLKQGRNDEALKDINMAIEQDPEFFEAYYTRGIIHYNQKNYVEAISNYSKAIEIKIDFAQAYYNRGLAEYYLNKKNEACADLKQATSLGFSISPDIFNAICN